MFVGFSISFEEGGKAFIRNPILLRKRVVSIVKDIMSGFKNSKIKDSLENERKTTHIIVISIPFWSRQQKSYPEKFLVLQYYFP